MRPNNQRRQRGRNNGGGKQKFPSRNQSFDSNGPDVRVRGTAHQIYEKYMALAREATTSGDRILAESYYQYAEHYFRVIAAQGGFVRPSFDRMWDEEGGGEEGGPQGDGGPMDGQGEGGGEGQGGDQRRYDDRGYDQRQQGYGGDRGPGGGYDNRRQDQRRFDDRRNDDRRPDERRPDERRPDERRPDERRPDERRHDDRRHDDKRQAQGHGEAAQRDGGYDDPSAEGATPIPYPPRVRNLSDDPAFADQPQVDGVPFNGNSVIGADGVAVPAPAADAPAEGGEGEAGGRGDRQFRPRHPHFRRFRGAQRRERDSGEAAPAADPPVEPQGGGNKE